MAIKIYEDTVTKELVIFNGIEYRYPAYCEIQRQMQDGSYLIIKTIAGVPLLDKTIFSDLHDESGLPYVSFGDLKAALDGYFDSTI